MPVLRLTERAIKAIEPLSSVAEHWDDELAGFGLKAHPSGRKAWLVRWRDKTGKKRFQSGGTWPAVKAEEARRWARETLSRAALGLPIDQGVETNQGAILTDQGATISTLWSEYVNRATGGEKRNRENIGKLHVLPVLRELPVLELKSAQVDKIVRSLADKPRTGSAVKTHLHGAYELARVLNMFPEDKQNPAALVKGYRYKPRTRRLSDDELARVGNALRDISKNRVFELLHAELITILLLTGARVGELVSATWDMLEKKHPALVLYKHKTDARGVRRVELGPKSIHLLAGLPRRSEMIFYGRAGQGRITEVTRPWAVVRSRAGIEHATVHDLRRTFASACLNDGMSEQNIGILLGHSGLSTTGIYALPDLKFRQSLIACAEASVARRLFL